MTVVTRPREFQRGGLLLPFRETSSSTSCMKLAISGGSLWISLSLSPSFRSFTSWKNGCKTTTQQKKSYKPQDFFEGLPAWLTLLPCRVLVLKKQTQHNNTKSSLGSPLDQSPCDPTSTGLIPKLLTHLLILILIMPEEMSADRQFN